MQTAFSARRLGIVALLFLTIVCASSKIISIPGGGRLSARAGRGGAVLSIQGRPKVAGTLPLLVDGTVKPGSVPALQLVGNYGPATILVEDTYYSRPEGLSNCQAGQEQFLRVIVLGRPNRETLRLKLRSCRDNLEMSDAGVVWKAEDGTIEVNWLAYSAANARTHVRYQLSKTGEARLTS